MPYGRTSRSSKMRTKRSAPRKPTTKMVKEIVQKSIAEQTELKCKYTTFDELTVTSGGEESLTGFTELSRGNGSDQRIGNKIKPKQLIFEGWFRPRSLADTITDPNVPFRTGQYIRASLLRVRERTQYSSTTNNSPIEVGTQNSRLFIGNGGLPVGESGDFADIMRPYNWNLIRPMNKGCDKEFYLSMSPYTPQTKRFKYVINFSEKDEMSWSVSSSSKPDNGLFQLFVWSRFASDDVQIASDIEFVGQSRFYYTDA